VTSVCFLTTPNVSKNADNDDECENNDDSSFSSSPCSADALLEDELFGTTSRFHQTSSCALTTAVAGNDQMAAGPSASLTVSSKMGNHMNNNHYYNKHLAGKQRLLNAFDESEQ